MAWSFYDSNGVLQSGGSGGGATAALDNLASVAINTSLISDTDNTDDLGSSAAKWKDLFLLQTLLEERTAPGTPASGDVALYAKTDGLLYSKDDAGAETVVSGGAGDFTQVADESPSAVASVDVSGITGSGGDLIIEGFLLPVTDDVGLWLRLNNYSGASDYMFVVAHNQQGTKETANASAAAHIEIAADSITATRMIGNAIAKGISFHVRIPNYAEAIASENPLTIVQASAKSAAAFPLAIYGMGSLLKVEAVTRVTLLFSSGNIASGHVRIYTLGT